jgi:hypothetical protein
LYSVHTITLDIEYFFKKRVFTEADQNCFIFHFSFTPSRLFYEANPSTLTDPETDDIFEI